MNAKIALLHIGTPKTGTTSIQECLANAETVGALGSYRYPLYRGDRDHNRLTMLYLPHAQQPPARRVEFPRDDTRFRRTREHYRRFLFTALEASGGAILSGEALGGQLTTRSAIQLRSDLESLGFEEFHVALYARHPVDFYLSQTQQLLRGPVYPTPPVIDPAIFSSGLRRRAENWEKAFPGRIIVRIYPFHPTGDILDDFSELMRSYLGIVLPPSPSATRLNTTVSAEGMVVLEQYRRAVGPDESGLRVPGLDKLVAFLMSSRQRIPQTRPVLKVAVAEKITVNHRQEAEFLFSKYGVDLRLGPSDAAQLPSRLSWRVEDILESVDPDIVSRLWDEFKSYGTDRRRPLPLHAAERLYRAVPHSRRPAGLDAWLRSRFTKGPQA